MQGADLSSLIVGALLAFVASVSGLWFRRNWERFDDDQTRCRQDLIELARGCELARIAVRQTHRRGVARHGGQSSTDQLDQMLKAYAQEGEAAFECTSRVRRLKPGELRTACATYVYLLEAYAWSTPDAPSMAELDRVGQQIQLLIQAVIEQVETRRASTFAVRGATLTCPPAPYSTPLPGPRS